MHELSICGAIAGIVSEHAGERHVETIHVRVGRLRQIVPDTLVYCWMLVSADTALDGSHIEVETVPAAVTCRACGATTELGDLPLLQCSACSGIEVDVVSGQEFLVTSLELLEA